MMKGNFFGRKFHLTIKFFLECRESGPVNVAGAATVFLLNYSKTSELDSDKRSYEELKSLL